MFRDDEEDALPAIGPELLLGLGKRVISDALIEGGWPRNLRLPQFRSGHRLSRSNPQKMRFCPGWRQPDLNPLFDFQPVWMSALTCWT